MSISESIKSLKEKYGKFLLTTLIPIMLAIFGAAFAVYQYYESIPDLKVEVESIRFSEGEVSLLDRKVDVRSVKTIVKLHSDSSSRTSGDRALLPYLLSIKELNEFISILESKVKSIEAAEEKITQFTSDLNSLIDNESAGYVDLKKVYSSDTGKDVIRFVGQSIFGDDFEYRRFRTFDGAVNLIKSRRYEFNPENTDFKRVETIDVEAEVDNEAEIIVRHFVEKFVKKEALKSEEDTSYKSKDKKASKKKSGEGYSKEKAAKQLALASKSLLPSYISQRITEKKDEYASELNRAQEIHDIESNKVAALNKGKSRLEVNSIIMNLGSQGTAIRPYSILRIQLNANSKITIPLSIDSENSTNIASSGVTKVVFYSEDRNTARKLLEKVDGAMNKDVESVLIVQDIQGITHSSKKTHISYQTFKESIIEELTVEAHKAGF